MNRHTAHLAILSAVFCVAVMTGRPPLVTPAQAAPMVQSGVTLPDFATLVERVGPAVVNISVVQELETEFNAPPELQDFLRRFGIPFPGMPGGPNGRGGPPQISRGVGSGFIVSADGYVLTNAHVVDDATEVTVRLTDKREFKAKVVGADTRTDVALLKIDASGLPTVRIGRPDASRVGEWVVAVGSPFGFDNTVTAGIISAKARRLPEETYVPFIQTDVAINPGNSGGPLFNLDGEVIGINSQIYSHSGGCMGISFAIPIDVAIQVKDQLLAHGTVTRGRIGVGIQDLNQALSDSFGLDSAQGALVTQVEPDSPGDKAGLKAGDVILALDGTPIRGSGELPPKVAAMKPGTEATLQVWRDGHKKDIEVTIGKLQAEEQVASADTGDADQARLGVAVRPLTDQERKQADLDGGLVVGQVGGAAARAGIQPGDVVLAVNGKQVDTIEQLRELVAKSGKHVALLIQRDEARIFVPIDLG